jgi:hypothetical protein
MFDPGVVIWLGVLRVASGQLMLLNVICGDVA